MLGERTFRSLLGAISEHLKLAGCEQLQILGSAIADPIDFIAVDNSHGIVHDYSIPLLKVATS